MSEHAHIPVTKNARHQRIIDALATGQVRSQTSSPSGCSPTGCTSPRPRSRATSSSSTP
jgi:hypothetical protein